MITLLSGRPGSGKSLRAVQLMFQFVAEGRAVYAFGFKELTVPGVITKHNVSAEECSADLAALNRWQELPAGAVLFADEVQKLWPKHGSADPIPPVKALAVHRSDYSMDMVLITQDPRSVSPDVRRQVTTHEHRVRKFNGAYSWLYVWDECQEDPQTGRSDADATVWLHPKECYGFYKSAEVHTQKTKIPTRLKIAGLLIPVVCVGFWYAWSSLSSAAAKDVPEGETVDEVIASDAKPEAPGRIPRIEAPQTAEEYVERFAPRVHGLPWTAPAYDRRAVLSQPQVYCISSENSCTCLSEQGTKLVVDRPVCVHIARNGVYNPYKAPMVSPASKPAVQPEKREPEREEERQAVAGNASQVDPLQWAKEPLL